MPGPLQDSFHPRRRKMCMANRREGGFGDPRTSGRIGHAWRKEEAKARKGVSCESSSGLLKLIDLIIKRLEVDAQLLGGGGLVAVVLLQDHLDVLHLDVAEGGVPLGDLEVGSADRRGGQGRAGQG